jgi:hypothetical protein
VAGPEARLTFREYGESHGLLFAHVGSLAARIMGLVLATI